MTLQLNKKDFTMMAWAELLCRLDIKVHHPDLSDKDIISIQICVQGMVFEVPSKDAFDYISNKNLYFWQAVREAIEGFEKSGFVVSIKDKDGKEYNK